LIFHNRRGSTLNLKIDHEINKTLSAYPSLTPYVCSPKKNLLEFTALEVCLILGLNAICIGDCLWVIPKFQTTFVNFMFVAKTRNVVLCYHHAYPQACMICSASELVDEVNVNTVTCSY
jgi:hypothetical protein